MGNKIITDRGKTELLRLGFVDGSEGAFNYIALGDGDSKAAQGEAFSEVNGDGYERVETTLETDIIGDEKQIEISGVFNEANYAVSGDGGLITEIGLCNSSITGSNDEVFFLYSEVPQIYKTDNISLKYTIIISID